MNIRFVEATIRGQTPALQPIVDSIVDVPEQYRANDVPSWAGSFRLKRHLFNWLNALGKVKFYCQQVEDGVYQYRVTCPFLKQWFFYVTPELVYMASNILHFVRMEDGATDMLFNFRERRFFIPCELGARFVASMFTILPVHGARIASFEETLRAGYQKKEATPDEEEKQEGKAQRVLH